MNHDKSRFVTFSLNTYSEYWYNLDTVKVIKITKVGDSCRVEIDNGLELKGDAALKFVNKLEELR